MKRQKPASGNTEPEGLSARVIIRAIAEHMLKGIEPLHSRAFAPSRYEVRLHPDDFDHLRGIMPAIEADAIKLLSEQLDRLNRGLMPKWMPFQPSRLTYEPAEGKWFISFLEDPDEELEPGQLKLLTELASVKSDVEGGNKTQLVSKRDRNGATRTDRVETDRTSSPALATITYSDDHGTQRYFMRKQQIVIGRSAEDAWNDIRLETKTDVSRQHIRIRYDPEEGRFSIKDLSTYGTTVNGERVPASLEQTDGEEVYDEGWLPLADRARIVLAGVIELDFERASE